MSTVTNKMRFLLLAILGITILFRSFLISYLLVDEKHKLLQELPETQETPEYRQKKKKKRIAKTYGNLGHLNLQWRRN